MSREIPKGLDQNRISVAYERSDVTDPAPQPCGSLEEGLLLTLCVERGSPGTGGGWDLVGTHPGLTVSGYPGPAVG